MKLDLPFAVQSMANLALHPNITTTSLIEIGLSLRPDIPREEDLDLSLIPYNTDIDLPCICFRCFQMRGIISGGVLQSSCNHCRYSDQYFLRPSLSSIEYALFSVTGYAFELWSFILLNNIHHHPRRML